MIVIVSWKKRIALMQSIFSNALSEAVSKNIELSATRRETLAWLTLSIMQQGTICLWRLAAYVDSAAAIASVRRRFYRFFQFVRLCEEIDGKVKAFLDRPIEGDWPYLWIDATYVKVRQAGRIVSVAVIVAVGVNTDGRREVLGMW